MYGKVANELKEPNEEILAQYAKIGETYDKLSKKIAEEFHPTSMFQVVQIKEETIRKMLKEINWEWLIDSIISNNSIKFYWASVKEFSSKMVIVFGQFN